MAFVKNSIMFGVGGGSNITVVANYSALPDPTTVSGQFYWCESSQGTSWLPGSLGGTYYNSGMYYSNGVSWSFVNVPYQATQDEVNTGTNTDKFVTPNTFANASKWNTKQDISIVVSSNTTASNNSNYVVVANMTFTDPTPVEGFGYVVFVRNGTATIGGTGYGVGSFVYRVYHSGAWSNTIFLDQTQIGSATQTALNKIENFIYSKSNQILGSHTGNTAETVLLSIDISGGEFVAGDIMTAFSILNKTGTNGTATLRYRVGTTGTTADALIATGNAGANTDISYTLERRRPQFLTSNILGVLRNNTATITDVAVTSRYDTISLNPSSAWKFTITVQLSNSGDSVELIQHRIGKIKSF